MIPQRRKAPKRTPLRRKGQKAPTAAEKAWMDAVAGLGCIVDGCNAPPGIHHCGTYMGGGRDHLRVLPLCHEHHQGWEGIDGKRMAKRIWEQKYGTEEALMAQVAEQIKHQQVGG